MFKHLNARFAGTCLACKTEYAGGVEIARVQGGYLGPCCSHRVTPVIRLEVLRNLVADCDLKLREMREPDVDDVEGARAYMDLRAAREWLRREADELDAQVHKFSITRNTT